MPTGSWHQGPKNGTDSQFSETEFKYKAVRMKSDVLGLCSSQHGAGDWRKGRGAVVQALDRVVPMQRVSPRPQRRLECSTFRVQEAK